MNPAELFFLLLGAALGMVAGAGLLDLVRGHPDRPEVRVTITRNALPVRMIRPETHGEPVTLRRVMRGPGTPAAVPVAPPVAAPARSRSSVASPAAARAAASPTTASGRVPLRVWDDVDPMLVVLRAADGPRSGAVALLERPMAEPITAMAPANEPARAANAAHAAEPAELENPDVAAGPCAGPRQRTQERCLVATQARDQAEQAALAARAARRDYDTTVQEGETASRIADPRAIAARKEAARRAFREATAAARERRDQEAAATVWLTTINHINHERRDALTASAAAGRRMEELLPVIERQQLAADATRITAETATAACNDARSTLAACEEEHARGGAVAVASPAGEGDRSDHAAPEVDQEPRATPGHQPAIYRMLQGDGAALAQVVEAAATGPQERSQLQLSLSGLVDAIVAGAIEQAFLNFPATHPFWGGLGRVESRQIAVGLAGLGYRFDGLGGFDAGRVPSARDLSLAVGYAGLDPRRMRHWPSEAESHDLYRDVTVAAAEFLAAAAPELSLSELVTVLGRRSESLADLWNQWGHVRPLLMTPTS